MRKSEIYDTLLQKVSEVCEVNKSMIINGSRLKSVVDARVLAVQYLVRIGLSYDDIALITLRRIAGNPGYFPSLSEIKKKARSVQTMFCAYSSHCMQSYAFCLMSKEIKEFCISEYKTLYLAGMKGVPMD